MKRAFAGITAAAALLAFAGAATAATAPPAHRAPAKKSAPKLSKWQLHVLETMRDAAPGDEYFGRMKMSYLGINNEFRDDSIRAGAYTTDPHLISRLLFADEALNAWARKYPRDPQLARSYFLAFQMYRKVWTLPYQQKAWTYANLLVHKWPTSYFGKAMIASLKNGFTEHYFQTPVLCGQIAAASPDPHAKATATPSPTPSPTPTPTPAPGQPKLDILPVPCVTPTPSPSPVSSVTPSPAPTR